MPHELYVIKQRLTGALFPADAVSREAFDALPRLRNGDAFRCVLTAPRNPKRNRWFHALLTVVGEAYDEPMEAVKVWLKFRLGLVEKYRVGDRIIEIPRSVSFAAMDEFEFARFCDRSVRVIAEELMGGVPEGALRQQIEEMMG